MSAEPPATTTPTATTPPPPPPPSHLSTLPLSNLKNLASSSLSSSPSNNNDTTTTVSITDLKKEVLRRLYLRQHTMSEEHFDTLMTLSAGYISEYEIAEEALEEKRLLVYLEFMEELGDCIIDMKDNEEGGGGGGEEEKMEDGGEDDDGGSGSKEIEGGG